MQVKGIPLPADAASRGMDWPCVVEPTAVELAAIEAELAPLDDAADWERWADDLVMDAGELAAAVAAFGDRVPPSAATVRRWQDLSTVALVELAQAGHLDALDPLFRRFDLRLRRAAWRRAEGNATLADDAVSETWLRVTTSIGTVQCGSEDDFLRWLFGVLKHAVRRACSARGREALVLDGMSEEVVSRFAVSGGGEAVNAAQVQALRDKLMAAVDDLTPRQREVLRLRLDSAPTDEIIERTGLSWAQINSSERAAQDTLRLRLADPLADADPARVRAAAQLLPARQCQVFLMQLDGVGRIEIAERTGLTYAQVRNASKEARIGVRRRLMDARTVRLDNLAGADRAAEHDRDRVRKAAHLLPEAQRQVVLLRLEGKTHREIAEAVDSNHKTVSDRWQSAQAKLQRLGVIAGPVNLGRAA